MNTRDFCVSTTRVYTIDSLANLRAWQIDTGALVWEQVVEDAKDDNVSIWVFEKDSKEYVAISGGVVLEALTGKVVDSPRASDKPKKGKNTEMNVLCPEMETSVALESSSFTAWRVDNKNGKHKDALNLTSDFHLSPKDEATGLVLTSCRADAMTVLVTTKRGTTSYINITGSKELEATTVWQQEEGLAQVTLGLMLDSSHYVGDVGEDMADTLLQFPNRLQSQWKSITEMLIPSAIDRRDHFFGFVKVALLVSSSSNRLYALDTSGPNRSKIRYQIDLPSADWHRLVHGTANAHKATHGINGGTHTREVLVLSKSGNSLSWNCLEGTDGNVHSQGQLSIASNVVQTIPLLTSGGSCRQSAVLCWTTVLLSRCRIQARPKHLLYSKSMPVKMDFIHMCWNENRPN